MSFLTQENVEYSESRPAAGEFQHFHAREIHFREPFTGINVIRVFITEYVEKEM